MLPRRKNNGATKTKATTNAVDALQEQIANERRERRALITKTSKGAIKRKNPSSPEAVQPPAMEPMPDSKEEEKPTEIESPPAMEEIGCGVGTDAPPKMEPTAFTYFDRLMERDIFEPMSDDGF